MSKTNRQEARFALFSELNIALPIIIDQNEMISWDIKTSVPKLYKDSHVFHVTITGINFINNKYYYKLIVEQSDEQTSLIDLIEEEILLKIIQ